MNLSTQQLIRYGVSGALAVVVVAGAVYLFDRSRTATPPTTADDANPPAAPAAAAAKPASQARHASRPTPTRPAVPSAAQTDQVARLLGDARRLAQDGNFADAKAALDKADAVMPGSDRYGCGPPRDQPLLSTPQGQLALQLDRARAAIAQDDSAAAEKALAEAERLNPQAPEIASLRQALQDAQQKEAQRSSRVAQLLADDARSHRPPRLQGRQRRLQRGRADQRPRSGDRAGARRARQGTKRRGKTQRPAIGRPARPGRSRSRGCPPGRQLYRLFEDASCFPFATQNFSLGT